MGAAKKRKKPSSKKSVAKPKSALRKTLQQSLTKLHKAVAPAPVAQPGKIQIVVSAVVVQDGKVLLVQEGRNRDYKGTWALPGGRLEFGEAPIEGVKRELREETGLEIEPTGYTGIYTYVSKFGNFTFMLNFVARATGGTLIDHNEEIQALRWVPLSEFEQMTDAQFRAPNVTRRLVRDSRQKTLPLDIIRTVDF